jgi:hypothetical protein
VNTGCSAFAEHDKQWQAVDAAIEASLRMPLDDAVNSLLHRAGVSINEDGNYFLREPARASF